MGELAYLPVRMLNESVYCPRLFHLEYVQGEWAENRYTVEGSAAHAAVDRPTQRGRPSDAGFPIRSLTLSSSALGLIAKLDVAESSSDGSVIPVEFKRGNPHPGEPGGLYLPERVQLCAQALLLREAGHEVPYGAAYFSGTKRRTRLELTPELEHQTREAIQAAYQIAGSPTPPAPLMDSPKCDGCSLVSICLPDEVSFLSGAAHPLDTPVRRLHAARDETQPLYVQQSATKLGISKDVLQVKDCRAVARGKLVGEAKVAHTSHVALFGSVQVSTQALRRLLREGIPVFVYSAGGWFQGWSQGLGSKNVLLRQAQYRCAADPVEALGIARSLVVSKVHNQRTLLRRNGDVPEKTLSILSELGASAGLAERVESLLGYEGSAARSYFGAFASMLKVEPDGWGFQASGRNRRPPRDPLNAALSFAYALLVKDCQVALLTAGLDPLLGFLHKPRYGRPALALDLMEEFRPLIADSVVLTTINRRELTLEHFIRRGDAVALSAAGRKRILAGYERRLASLVTHPVFGYRVSYRRVLEIQARLLARTLTGEVPHYPGFRTR